MKMAHKAVRQPVDSKRATESKASHRERYRLSARIVASLLIG